MKKLLLAATFTFAVLAGFVLSKPTFADDDDKEDLPCRVAREVNDSLKKTARYTPAPVRPAVERVIRETEDYRRRNCQPSRGGAGRAD